MKNWGIPFRVVCLMLLLSGGAPHGFSGVSRAVQDGYKKEYENKAMFLKIPVYAEKQMIYISGSSFRVAPGSGEPRYKVGDQLRVLAVDFGGDEVKVRLSGIAAAGLVELAFKFDAGLQEDFPNRHVFERALQATLTEGLRYTDLEDAKRGFVIEQFDRSVREMAGSASISREAVLRSIAPQVPAYQDAQREIENLKSRVQDVSGQLAQSQSEHRKLESESRAQQAELVRLKTANASLQQKIETYNTELSKLGNEVRDAKGSALGYQKELETIQRSLNLRVDSTRDLAMQISDLGQALKKLQKDNQALTNQISSLRTDLKAQEAANVRLVGENEEFKASTRKLQSTIATLTSKEDSLARRYLNLKNEKERLDDLAQAVRALRTRIVSETTEGGAHHGKANVYVKDVLLGSLDWNIPAHLNHAETRKGEAVFSTESIDYVRVTPEERHILRTLGEKLKIRVDLVAGSEAMAVTHENGDPVRDVAERDRSTWQWSVENRGTKDTPLILTARLINRDSNEISLLQQERPVTASNMVRRIRGYLQPIPLAAGVVIGFLLFGIVGIFRRPKSRHSPAPSAGPSDHVMKKKL